MAELVICKNCDGDCSYHYIMCDLEPRGEYCPECFADTPCGLGMHGEGCPTIVFTTDVDMH